MEVTNGTVDPAHYGPIGDAARHVASYCDGAARVHVYTAAFTALATTRAELAASKERERETLAVLQTAHESEAALVAERDRLREMIAWAVETLQEINPSNYGHDDVCALNAASVEVCLGLDSVLTGDPA